MKEHGINQVPLSAEHQKILQQNLAREKADERKKHIKEFKVRLGMKYPKLENDIQELSLDVLEKLEEYLDSPGTLPINAYKNSELSLEEARAVEVFNMIQDYEPESWHERRQRR